MKKEDTKENATEPQSVFIENLPQPKRWWQEYAFFIAILALCVSIYSAYLARKEIIAAHRPYVCGISTTTIPKNEMDVKRITQVCLNAPAKIINREIYYIAIKKQESGKEICEIKYEKIHTPKVIIYPSEKQRSWFTIQYDFKKEILAKYPEAKLRRKVRIDYKELSTDRTYYFEGNWDYNRQHDVWEPNDMFGN